MRLLAAIVALAVVSGCSGSDTGDGAASTSADRSGARAAEVDTSEGSTPPTTLLVSVDDFGLDEAQRRCVLEVLEDDVDPAAVPDAAVQDAMAVCVRAETFGPAFSAGLAERYPGVYSTEQLACLDGAYSSLPPDDYDLLLRAGLDPEGSDGERAQQILRALFDGCDAERPPDLDG